MGPPELHEEEEHRHVDHLDSQQNRQLGRVGTEETVGAAHDEHAARGDERSRQQPVDTSAPVVQDILRQLPTEPVGQEGADHREPDDEEVEQVVEHVDELVPGVEAEAEAGLGEEQEAEVLQVPVEEEGDQVDDQAEGAQQLLEAGFPQQLIAPAKEEEGQRDEEEVEGEELPAGGQEGLPPAFHLPELGLCVVELGVDSCKGSVSAGAHLGIEHLGGLLLDYGPLLVLQLLHIREHSPHVCPVVPFMVLVEPEFVDVDQEAEEGEGLPAARHPVEHSYELILEQKSDYFVYLGIHYFGRVCRCISGVWGRKNTKSSTFDVPCGAGYAKGAAHTGKTFSGTCNT